MMPEVSTATEPPTDAGVVAPSRDALATVMVIGGGARSHALGEAIAASPTVGKVVFAPGTTGLEHLGYETVPVASQDLAGLVEAAMLAEVDLSVVGPNTPLVDGIVDRFLAAQLPVFGPDQASARLEGSKAFARLLMGRLGVPTPRFAVCDNKDRALHLAHSRPWARVFKADGIAYDKGVRVTHHRDEADDALTQVLIDNVYGLESERIVVEERIDGTEITVFCLTDGVDVYALGHVLNYPRLLDGNLGPPTRGMGQVSPAPMVDDTLVERIMADAIRPVVNAMAERGTPLSGALFADLMLVAGEPYVIDFNVRFGDPATQTMLSAYSGDIFGALCACRGQGDLKRAIAALEHDERPRVTLVAVCEGYPTTKKRGAPIAIDRSVFDADPDLRLYFDGVRATDAGLETTGGRTCTVVAAGATVAEARERAYRGMEAIRFAGRHIRSDIGLL